MLLAGSQGQATPETDRDTDRDRDRETQRDRDRQTDRDRDRERERDLHKSNTRMNAIVLKQDPNS